DVAYKIKPILEKAGIKVIMTVAEDDKTDPALAERVAIANEAGNVDLYVSIHANALGYGEDWTTPSGWEIYHNGEDPDAEQAAKSIRAATLAAIPTIKDRGVKVESFHVIVNTKMPAVLIEHGFYTNQQEVELLKSDSYRGKLAAADAQGIINFFKLYK
ncbi:MAG: N-acetylmuramoyl-L-alanine amidase, partial [Firmicutes bacterium]|nr:N-acetylmuramoyl-L-alanine amidase [Bacillota bacterium]